MRMAIGWRRTTPAAMLSGVLPRRSKRLTACRAFSNEASSAKGMRREKALPCHCSSRERPAASARSERMRTSAPSPMPQAKQRTAGGSSCMMASSTAPSRPMTTSQRRKRRAFSRSFCSCDSKFSLWASPRWVKMPTRGRMISSNRSISPGWEMPASMTARRHCSSMPNTERGTPIWEL